MNILKMSKLSIPYKICIGLLLLFICLFIYSIINRGQLIKLEKNIKEINENFTNKDSFTMYYVDWCPHCINAKPEFKQLIKNMPIINGKNIEYNMIDCVKNPEKAEKENIESYPTIILYKNNKK